MGRPLLLDLFCGAGGAAVGYHRAGFEVLGVDLHPQPNYPFSFIRDDALAYLDEQGTVGFEAIHASPPCQAYSSVTGIAKSKGSIYPDLIHLTRMALERSGLPWIIENVIGAMLFDPLRLCGSMFGLPTWRHRLFEMPFPSHAPSGCRHGREFRYRAHHLNRHSMVARTIGIYGKPRDAAELATWQKAMGIDWMSGAELAQAIPPAYTEWVGRFLMSEIIRRRGAAGRG
jgi:DNA (cytosine-5)-methyltransferase 1